MRRFTVSRFHGNKNAQLRFLNNSERDQSFKVVPIRARPCGRILITDAAMLHAFVRARSLAPALLLLLLLLPGSLRVSFVSTIQMPTVACRKPAF